MDHKNIENVFRLAGGQSHPAAHWYAVARAEIQALAVRYGLDWRTVAGMVAATSPRMMWAKNLEAVQSILGGRPRWVMRANLDKARRILAGEEPLDVLSGPKVRSFYQNLVDPDSDAVTVDVWAWRVAVNDYTITLSIREPHYSRAVEAYRKAAAILEVAPHVVQAVTWQYAREVFPVAGGNLERWGKAATL